MDHHLHRLDLEDIHNSSSISQVEMALAIEGIRGSEKCEEMNLKKKNNKNSKIRLSDVISFHSSDNLIISSIPRNKLTH